LSAIIAAVVSILTTRYTLKHGPNYAEQINGLHDTIGSLARTQEELRKQQAEQAQREDARYAAEVRRIEAAKWKPIANIINVNEGREHVNKLSIGSTDDFRVIEVSLLSESGAKVYEFPFNLGLFSKPVRGQNIPIPHSALNQAAGASSTYGPDGNFTGAIQFTVERAEGEQVRYTGEVKFTASDIMLGNTRWFHLVG
jgi:hypothetical protein